VSRMLPRDHGGVHACAGVMSGIQRCIRGPRYGSCMMGGHMQPGQRGAQARRGPPSLLLATCGVGYWWTRPKASAPLGPPSASPTNGAVRLAPPGQLPGRRQGRLYSWRLRPSRRPGGWIGHFPQEVGLKSGIAAGSFGQKLHIKLHTGVKASVNHAACMATSES
jgi:hypothetical protein